MTDSTPFDQEKTESWTPEDAAYVRRASSGVLHASWFREHHRTHESVERVRQRCLRLFAEFDREARRLLPERFPLRAAPEVLEELYRLHGELGTLRRRCLGYGKAYTMARDALALHLGLPLQATRGPGTIVYDELFPLDGYRRWDRVHARYVQTSDRFKKRRKAKYNSPEQVERRHSPEWRERRAAAERRRYHAAKAVVS